MTTASNSANGAMLSAHATELETSTGRFVDVNNPDPGTIHLHDIAQGLAHTCRYGGQINRFYSVAEHSVLVHDLLQTQGADGPLLIAALFHDAAEAYLGDVIAPLKYALRGISDRSFYDHLSARMDAAITLAFNLPPLYGSDPGERLQAADMWALRIEARALTHTGGKHWRWPHQLPNQGEKPATVQWLGGRKSGSARALWLDRCADHGITP